MIYKSVFWNILLTELMTDKQTKPSRQSATRRAADAWRKTERVSEWHFRVDESDIRWPVWAPWWYMTYRPRVMFHISVAVCSTAYIVTLHYYNIVSPWFVRSILPSFFHSFTHSFMFIKRRIIKVSTNSSLEWFTTSALC